MQIEVSTFYDELDLPRSIRDRLETLTGVEVLYSQSFRTDSPNNIYSLPPDALIRDLTVTIRIFPDTIAAAAAAETGMSIFLSPIAPRWTFRPGRSKSPSRPGTSACTTSRVSRLMSPRPQTTPAQSWPCAPRAPAPRASAPRRAGTCGAARSPRACTRSPTMTVGCSISRKRAGALGGCLRGVGGGELAKAVRGELVWCGRGGRGPPGGRDENVGAIVGVLVGGVAAVVLIAVAVWFWRKKKRTKTAGGEEEVPWQQRVGEYVPITGRAEMVALGVDVVKNELDGVARRERVYEP